MIALVPLSLAAQTQSAIVHTQGGVWVNGYEAKDSSAVFSGDVVETRPEFSATLNLEGSSISVQPESVVKFQGESVELDHGSIAVDTSTGFKVLVNCITVVPVANEWTQYEVVDLNGSVQLSARTKDVNVKWERVGSKPSIPSVGAQQEQGSVHQGEQKKYDESEACGAPPKPSAGSLPNPKWIAAAAGGAGVLIWIVIHGGGGKTPVSASTP